MKIQDIKKEMLNYRDFWGGDLIKTDEILKAKTKKDLKKILEDHRHFMEDQLCDAHSHLDNFIRRVDLSII